MQKVTELCFVDIRFTEETQEIQPALMGFVHAFNSEHGSPLGVDFPKWSSTDRAANVDCVRLFGKEDAFQKFFAQPRMARLGSLLGCAFMLKAIPAYSQLAAVTRDNTADKNKPGHARRLERRAMARGETAPPELKKSGRSAAAMPFTSKSTGQSFLMKLKKAVYEGPAEVVFNSYGLCKQGGLPQF
jgi:CRISPR-associated endonuclease Csy4